MFSAKRLILCCVSAGFHKISIVSNLPPFLPAGSRERLLYQIQTRLNLALRQLLHAKFYTIDLFSGEDREWGSIERILKLLVCVRLP